MGLGLKEMPPPGADRRSQGQRAEIWVVSGIQETWSCDTMSRIIEGRMDTVTKLPLTHIYTLTFIMFHCLCNFF